MIDIEQNFRVLDYWLHIEALTAPDAESQNEKGHDLVVSYIRDHILPWQEKLLPTSHKHFVRFGVIPRAAYEKELLHALEASAPLPDLDSGIYADHKEFTFLGIFEVDESGLPQAGTLDMAAFAPAFAALIGKCRIAFKEYKQWMTETFDEACETSVDEKKPVDISFIRTLASSCVGLLGWTPEGMEKAPLVIVRTAATANQKGYPVDPSVNPINGFFFDDICRVKEKHKAELPTGLITTYLAEPDQSKRIDCTSIDILESLITIDRMPDGRWPSKHALTLMQQVAVNQALANRREQSSLFSVNGPPGTGKTTLLMDIVAALVVERAKLLCSYDNPASAFKKKWEVTYPSVANPIPIYALDEKLHGFSMVVASSNNGAVENITHELPNLRKLDQIYWKAEYFSELATVLISSSEPEDEEADGDEKPEPIKAWGLVSARLGRKKNLNTFINTLNKYDTVKGANGEKQRVQAPHNIFRLLKEAKQSTSWSEARQRFAEALNDVHTIKDGLKAVARLEEAINKSDQAVRGVEAECEALRQRFLKLRNDEPVLTQEVGKLNKRAQDAQSALHNLLPSRPGFFARLFHTKAFRSWTNEWHIALNNLQNMQQQLRTNDAALETCQQNLTLLPKQLNQTEARLVTLREKAGNARIAHSEACGEGYVGFSELRQMSSELREQTLPLSNTALHNARAVLFLRALDVEKVFATSDSFIKNLRRALDMLDGKAELRPKLPEIAVHLWETLFILMPVVSTTFASLARNFNHLGSAQIGWLLIDEAGQAVPQQAVGALYRAKHAVIVGDPLQVKPVIKFNKAADSKLLAKAEVPQRYQSTGASVQVLADNVNRVGSQLRGNWVGCPLRVHRRCVEPMFSISNAIAYEGKMVLGKGKMEEEAQLTAGDSERKPRPILGDSRWINATSTDGQRENYLPEQGELALELIRQFMNQGWTDDHKYKGLPLVFVISPFKSVAREFTSLLFRTRRQWAGSISSKVFERWVKASIGTVNTFQGKEQESVILLLGGTKEGAIRWASESPNILNVGVTRAQRRLYVIGDRRRWIQNDLAQSVADKLPVEASRRGEAARG